MPRIAYFQPFSGLSGDMVLGSLVDAGLSLERLEEGLRTLGLPGWKLTARKEMRGPFHATRLRVHIEGQGEKGASTGSKERRGGGAGNEAGHGHSHEHGHGHEHQAGHEHSHEHGRGHEQVQDAAHGHGQGKDHSHSHGHSHGHTHEHGHEHSHEHARGHEQVQDAAHGHGHGHEDEDGGKGSKERGLAEILDILARSGLPEAVKRSASAVFQRLGRAEAKVHGIPLETVHFHEVGALDSIIDITGACLGLHLLGVEEVHSAPVTVGTGFVRAAHGQIPLPAPATLELLVGFPIEHRDSRAELTTPTGAALITTLARSFGTMPPLTVTAVGYGAGDDRPGPVPNVLRVILGERSPSPAPADRVLVLETTIDDMSPQWTGHLIEKLFEAGALDACVTPVLMKKSRPGHDLRVLAPLEAEARILRTIFSESTTLGLRRTVAERVILERESHPVETPWGPVRVKVGRMGTEVMTATPEYEDLRAAAARAGLPLKEIHAQVMESYRRDPTQGASGT